MHCPNCGSEAPMEQKFCRSCGFGLGKVARLITEQAPDENLDSASDPKGKMLKRLRFFRISFILFGSILAWFSIFGIYHVISVNEEVRVFGSVVIVFIVGLLLLPTLGISIVIRRMAGEQKSPRPSSSTNAPTTKKLPHQPGLETNASVTEQTTANLAEKIEN